MSNPPSIPSGFLDLPPQIYARYPAWIPEEPTAVEASFSTHNPWFDRGSAALWCEPGSSRVAGFFLPAARPEGVPAAYFGYWETESDVAASASLFGHLERWAKSRGAARLYGPINFDTFGSYRLCLPSEDSLLPFPGEPFNPPAYPEILESLGFETCRRYLTQVVEPAPFGHLATQELEPFRRRALAAGYRFEALTRESWLASEAELYDLIHRSFASNFAFVPPDATTFAAFARGRLILRACPRTSLLVRSSEGRLVGFSMVFPHYGPIATAGAPDGAVPVSQLCYEQHYPALKASGVPPDAIVKTVAICPEHRRQGLLRAMVSEAYQRTAGSWNRWWNALMIENNTPSRPARGRTSVVRDYQLFRKTLV